MLSYAHTCDASATQFTKACELQIYYAQPPWTSLVKDAVKSSSTELITSKTKSMLHFEQYPSTQSLLQLLLSLQICVAGADLQC